MAMNIGRFALKEMAPLRRYSCDAQQDVDSLNAMLREERDHHDRRERELNAKIRELRAECHSWQERYMERFKQEVM